MVGLAPLDQLGGRVTPMLDVYATAIAVVTIAAGIRCAWYWLTGPLQCRTITPKSPHLILGTIPTYTMIYMPLPKLTKDVEGYCIIFWQFLCYVNMLTQDYA